MSAKRFCDFCGAECTHQPASGKRTGEAWLSSQDHVRRGLQVEVEVVLTNSLTDVCTGCVFKAVRQIDPTPETDPT